MDKVEKLIKQYLQDELGLGRADKTLNCPDEQTLLEYLEGALDKEKRQFVEHHIAGCGFCLSQLSLASQSKQAITQGGFEPARQKLINKTKSRLGVYAHSKDARNNKVGVKNKRLFLAAAVVFFILSFIFPRYFMQFLVATLILGIRWAFESEGGRTLIMVLDSWRHHSHDKDDEISRRIKNRF